LERLKIILKKNEKIGKFNLLCFEGEFHYTPSPGNFYMLSKDNYEFILPRPFSVFDFKNGKIYFLIKKVGRFTDFLFHLKPGEEIFLNGPYGKKIEHFDKIIFIAGGIGFAPLHFHSLFTNDFYFFFGGTTKDEILCHKFIEKNIFVSTDDGSFGYKGDVLSLFKSHLNKIDFKERKIFACGPRNMLKELKKISEEIKIETYFYMEERMGCGFGGCKGCAIKTINNYRLLCKEGTVFLSSEVIFE